MKVSVLRAADLLALEVDLVNLNLETLTGLPPRLVRATPGQPAFVHVRFPPQAFVEHCVDEDPLGQLVNPFPPPVPSAMGDPSRLVFRVPDSLQSLPFTLETLLAWTRYEPVVAPNALPHPPGPHSSPGLATPKPDETALEVPYGLLVSPDRSAGWAHAIEAVTHDGRTELWHTRLGVRLGGRVDESRRPAVRALAATHGATFTDVLFGRALRPPLIRAVRQAIVRASSDFLTQPSPQPLQSTHLILSSLGAWTDFNGEWSQLPGLEPGLIGWRHVVAMGRDQYVRVVDVGHLCPFGHRAARIQISERKFKPGPGGQSDPVGYLTVRVHVVVQEPEKDFGAHGGLRAGYPFAGREMPLTRVRITTLTTPPLDAAATSTEPFFPVDTGGTIVRFQLEALDADGTAIDFAMPLLFVPRNHDEGPYELRDRYLSAGTSRRTADLRGQRVAFTPQAAGAATLETASVTFGAVVPARGPVPPPGHPSVLPSFASAAIGLSTIDHLFGTTSATTIAFHDRYLRHGFDLAANPGEVFARAATIDVPAPPSRSGALASPSMKVDGLSRSLGPVGGADLLAQGGFNPLKAFDAPDAKLLGVISLKDLIRAVAAGSTPAALAAQVPKILQTREGNALVTSYSWSPAINPIRRSGTPLVTTAQTKLTLNVTSKTPMGAGAVPSVSVNGMLSTFSLNLVEVIRVQFDALRFDSTDGRKMDLRADGIHVEFTDALRFVDTLAKALPAKGFSDGPTIRISSRGIATGYGIGLPSVGLGAFSLENIALSAELFLPLVDDPASLRLAFSSREHPFLVTYSAIGGGGFFAIVLNTRGIERIEGALEMGGNIALSLGIVSAKAQVMVGMFFAMTQVGTTITFTFTAYVRVSAAVELLGLIAISVDLIVSLSFVSEPSPGLITGEAAMTVGVRVLFFSKSITLRVGCTFNVKTGALVLRSFQDTFTERDWVDYCRAIA